MSITWWVGIRGVVRKLVLAVLLVTLQTAFAQQSITNQEKTAEDVVAKLVAEIRKQGRLPELRRIRDRYLRPDVCQRGAQGHKSPGRSTGIGPPEKVGMLSVFWYSTPDPNRPPPEFLDWIKGPAPQYEQPHRFSVGVCLFSNPEQPEARYWIEVGTYMSTVKSIINVPTWD
ncbi:MAG: hypothetical protein WBV69_19805 [Candidatus Sulfotelmatobacter sp.]